MAGAYGSAERELRRRVGERAIADLGERGELVLGDPASRRSATKASRSSVEWPTENP
jgi:hypothetical protein